MGYDVIFGNLNILSLPPQANQTVEVDPGVPNFLKNGGISQIPLPTGNNAAAARAATTAFIPDQQVPYAINYTLSYQRQWQQNWSVELRYLGTRGIHLPTQNRINVQTQTTATEFLPTFLARPMQAQIDALKLSLATLQAKSRFVSTYAAAGFNAQNIIAFLPNGNSSYHGFSSQLTRRFAQGWRGVGGLYVEPFD